jgi:hypothetical protein
MVGTYQSGAPFYQYQQIKNKNALAYSRLSVGVEEKVWQLGGQVVDIEDRDRLVWMSGSEYLKISGPSGLYCKHSYAPRVVIYDCNGFFTRRFSGDDFN